MPRGTRRREDRWTTSGRCAWGRGGPVVLLVVLSLTACSSLTTTEATSPLATLAATVPPPTATPTAAAPGPLVVALTVWVPEDLDPYGEEPGAALLARQLDGFNQTFPGVQVEVIVKKARGRGGLWDFMRTASAAAPSVLPDLVVLDAEDLRVAAQAGLLQAMDDLVPADLAADSFPFAVGMGDVDGQTMGVPVTAQLEHLAYRPSLLATPPVSWTDVLSAGVSFVFPAAGQDGTVNDATLAQYLGAGGHLMDGEGNPRLEEAPLTELLTFYDRGLTAGVISPTVVLSLADADQCAELFDDWQAGMAVVSSRRFWIEMDSSAAPASLPTLDGTGVALARGWVLALVTADRERQEQAMRLVEWLMDPEWYGAWTQSASYLPTTRSGLAAWTATDEERAALETVLEGAQPLPRLSIRAVVGPPLQTALEAVLEGRRTPAEAAGDAVLAVEP